MVPKLQQKQKTPAIITALTAVFTGLVAVATIIFAFPIPATSGYFNFGEIIIYTVAILFGPLVGAVSGGVGAMLADIYLGFGVFAPGTLVIKGGEGAIVGYLNKKLKNQIKNTTARATIAILSGGFVMVAGYFLYEQFVLGYGFAAALAEIPLNMVQMLVGLVVAVPLIHAVLRVFPQLKSLI
jgi:uncharacterized membrane protein